MRGANFRLKLVLGKRRLDPRHQIVPIGRVVGMLELAAAAFGEVLARRLLMVRPECERSIVENRVTRHCEREVPATGRHPVATRGNSNDQLVHSRSNAAGIAAARSSAIICCPASSAARPCSHTAAQAASKDGSPRATIAATMPASTSPVPAVANHAGAGGANANRPSGADTSVSGPL